MSTDSPYVVGAVAIARFLGISVTQLDRELAEDHELRAIVKVRGRGRKKFASREDLRNYCERCPSVEELEARR